MRVEEFLGQIRARQIGLKQSRVAYADRLALGFLVFDFIRPDEMKLSEIISWMLDPKGSHGQGSRFLDAFVDHFEIPWALQSSSAVMVRTEAPTSENRRIDILVKADGRGFAIENKPWAADQENQLSDYFEYLDATCPSGHCIIYLTQNGSSPSTESIPSKEAERRRESRQLLTVGYGELLPWIVACKSVCRASRVANFLDEFVHYIEKQFLGVEDVNERNMIVTAATSSDEMLESALQVIGAAEDIKVSLFRTLDAELQTVSASRGWRLKSTLQQSGARWTGLSFYFNPTDTFCFAVQFATKTRTGLTYGMENIHESNPFYNAVRDALLLELNPDRVQRSPTWPWWRAARPDDEVLPVEGDWSVNEVPWVALRRGEFAQKVIAAADRFHDILSRRGLLSTT